MKSKAPHIPALTRTFDTMPRCGLHRGDLLTQEGTCPRCAREADMTQQRTAEDAAEARRLQAMTRAVAGKRGAA